MEFTNKTTAVTADYRQAAKIWEQYTPSLRSLRRMQRICFFLPCAALIATGVYFASSGMLPAGVIMILLGAALLLLLLFGHEAVHRRQRRDPSRGREVQYVFTQTEIRRTVGNREDQIPYSSVIHILEGENIFLLVCGDKGDVLLRKDGFSAWDPAAFQEFLAQKTGRTIFQGN